MQTVIKELKTMQPGPALVKASGWVRTKRDSKNVCFIEVNDGTCLKGLQVVADKAVFDNNLLIKGRAAYDWAVETSIYVRKGLGRQGIGSGLYAALENMLKQQNIVNLYACIAAPEKEDEYLTRNSILFHERLGYELIGEFHKCGYKFGRWYNMVWMEKMIGEHLPDQPPVIWTDK